MLKNAAMLMEIKLRKSPENHSAFTVQGEATVDGQEKAAAITPAMSELYPRVSHQSSGVDI
jgi:hypothetical protein